MSKKTDEVEVTCTFRLKYDAWGHPYDAELVSEIDINPDVPSSIKRIIGEQLQVAIDE